MPSSYPIHRLVPASLLCLLACAPVAKATDDSLEPYRAYVARDGELARCGPGSDFYQTDPLEAGEEVEVYLETEDGWLGIRPPNQSFCWIQSDQVQVEEDESTGTVIDDAAVAWIGTHLGRAKQYRWQVKLDRGETVTIIGTARRIGPEGDDVWYRIVPPAGEFRWLHRSQVVPHENEVEGNVPQPQLARQETPSRREIARDNTSRRPSKPALPRPPALISSENTSVLDDAPVGSGLARTSATIDPKAQSPDRNSIASTDELEFQHPDPPSLTADATNASQDDWVTNDQLRTSRPREAEPAPRLRPVDHVELAPTAPSSMDALLSGPRFRVSDQLATADVETLRVELSRAMAASARGNEVEPLRQRASEIALRSTSTIDRGRAAILLKRIEEYQLVATRRDSQSVSTGTVPASALQTIDANSEVVTAVANEPSASSTSSSGVRESKSTSFDRQGILVRVYSARTNAPPYALNDSNGSTLCYVTPVPGINLRRFLNQEVGLYGRTAFDTSLETPHIIAEQAVRVRK